MSRICLVSIHYKIKRMGLLWKDSIQFNNFILRWYCTIAEANKHQPLITINMVKLFFIYVMWK